MAAIHDLLKQIEDPRLRERISREYETATRHKKFGLVFEQHLPEMVPIYSALPRRGDLVAKRGEPLKEVWRVRRVEGDAAILIQANQAGKQERADKRHTVPLADLLVVKQFGDPIFPTLSPIDFVQNGPVDAPWHTLIEADNYHALQLLEYLHSGKVDCIYIDPPYNSGAKDWKYNNDYVDENDSWRHSKWLSFMEKRLRLAKRLLNNEASILIVTIDEKEYLRLGLLLESVFPGCKVQFTTVVINPKGTARYNEFSRVEEYIFFVFIGKIKLQSFGNDMLTNRDYSSETHVRWRGLARTGRKGLRQNNPGSWYPIYLRKSDWKIHSIGDAVDLHTDENEISPPDGTVAIWPPRKDAFQYSWSTVPETLRDIWAKGGLKTGRIDHEKKSYPFYYLSSGLFSKIERGEIVVTGRGPSNELTVEFASGLKSAMPRSVWNRAAYDAGSHGTSLLQDILPNSGFPFPKSIYAVRDAIKFFMASKKRALVVDFFAGSGTTLNAVNLLNAADGGQRRCILVTNNEVAADEAQELTEQGLQPGDWAWDAKGICKLVTWPRSKFTILGRRDDDTPLTGDYSTGQSVEKERPRSFRHLAFVDPQDFRLSDGLDNKTRSKANKGIISKQKALVALIDGLPQNAVKEDCRFIVRNGDKATVLFDPDVIDEWLEALEGQDQMNDFYIVAESGARFKAIKEQVEDLLGPQIVREEEKRTMAEGFAANLAYFKLDFLEKDQVELGTAFREVLPLLWLKAGAIGPRPELPSGPLPDWFAPEGASFAVLLNEARINGLTSALKGRSGLSHVFIVTDAEEAFRALSDELRVTIGASNSDMQLVQLYRDYLVNFMINMRVEDAPNSTGSMA